MPGYPTWNEESAILFGYFKFDSYSVSKTESQEMTLI